MLFKKKFLLRVIKKTLEEVSEVIKSPDLEIFKIRLDTDNIKLLYPTFLCIEL